MVLSRSRPYIGRVMSYGSLLSVVNRAAEHLRSRYGHVLSMDVVPIGECPKEYEDCAGICQCESEEYGQPKKGKCRVFMDAAANGKHSMVSEMSALWTLDATFHEASHAKAGYIDSTEYGVPTRALAQFVAHQAPAEWYNDNHNSFLHELDADGEGFFATCTFLREQGHMPQERMEKVMTAFANYKFSPSRWPNVPAFREKMTSLQDVSDRLGKAWTDMLAMPAARFSVKLDGPAGEQTGIDWIQGMDLAKGEDSVWKPFFDKIQDAPNMITQQKRIASVMLHMEKGLPESASSLKKIPCLAQMDLSPEACFGEPFPEPPSWMVARVADFKLAKHNEEYHLNHVPGFEEYPILPHMPVDVRHPGFFQGDWTVRAEDWSGEQFGPRWSGNGTEDMDRYLKEIRPSFDRLRHDVKSGLQQNKPMLRHAAYRELNAPQASDSGRDAGPSFARRLMAAVEGLRSPDDGRELER